MLPADFVRSTRRISQNVWQEVNQRRLNEKCFIFRQAVAVDDYFRISAVFPDLADPFCLFGTRSVVSFIEVIEDSVAFPFSDIERFFSDRINQPVDVPAKFLRYSRSEPAHLIMRHQPTEPSSEIATSCCASMANSIGSSCSTSLQKPFTTSATASSSPIPRERQ